MSSSDAPPSYAQATDSKGSSSKNTRNGIPWERRRSMEDERRSLPEGWVRQFDKEHGHQFFVDTKADPPRSIWHHPHDDDEYLRTLPAAERERIEEMKRHPSHADIAAELTDEEADHADPKHAASSSAPAASSGAAASSSSSSAQHHQGKATSFGRKVKDKITGTTHEQREQERIQRAKHEEQMYRQHLAMRNAMARAEQTGQPQLVGKDSRTGQDIYIEPSYGQGGYPAGPQYYNPYGSNMPYYRNPRAQYIRPSGPYGRPYGCGYGGGFGLPLAGGLLGGALLGSVLF